MTVRFYEAFGRPAEVDVDSVFPVLGANRANILEEPGEPLATDGDGAGGRVRLRLAASELATFRLRLGPLAGSSGGAPGRGEDLGAEIAQPVFSRYWLHNKGPAPMGNQSLAVHVLPTGLVLRDGEEGKFIAQVASGSAAADRSTQSGHVEILAPPGWDVEPSGQLFSLRAAASVQVPARLRVPDGCRPGRYFLAVRVSGPADQSQEDILTVDVLPALAEAETGLARGGHPGGAAAHLAKAAPLNHPGGQFEAELEVALDTLDVAVGARGHGHHRSCPHQPDGGRDPGRAPTPVPSRNMALRRPVGPGVRPGAGAAHPGRGWRPWSRARLAELVGAVQGDLLRPALVLAHGGPTLGPPTGGGT